MLGALAIALAGMWLPAVQVAQAPVSHMALAVGAGGQAAVTWDQWNGATDDVFVSYRPAGAPAWPAPVKIGYGSTYGTANPSIALDSRGDAVAAWVAEPGDGRRVPTASLRPATTGVWQQPTALANDGASEMHAGMDDAGDALVVWDGYPSQSAYLPVAGLWQTAVPLPTDIFSDVSFFAGGTAALAGYRYVSSQGAIVQASIGDHGNWSRAAEFPLPNLWTNPQAAAGPGGSGVVAWSTNVGGNAVVQAVTHTGAGWGSPETLSFPDGQASDPVVAYDSAGDTLAIWDAIVDVEGSFRPAGGIWPRPIAVSPPATYPFPQLAMNAAGDAVAAWPVSLTATVFAPGSGWSPTVQLPGERTPEVGIDNAGDAVVAWLDESGVKAAVYDAGGALIHAPYAVRPPAISGAIRIGVRLRCGTGTWTGTAPLRYAYQWLRGTRVVASTPRYAVRRADAGKSLACRVTATNALGSASAASTSLRVRR